MWIEIANFEEVAIESDDVTLHTEGVDRNKSGADAILFCTVTLHTEGVDRNFRAQKGGAGMSASPSTRRVWIEITTISDVPASAQVTLHTEGVDRNSV